MLKCSTSLWSADLANLASEIRRVEPYTEQFHLDVADGHYVNTLLFFPDLVKALRPHTRLPLEVHLMTANPMGCSLLLLRPGPILSFSALIPPSILERCLKRSDAAAERPAFRCC